MRRRIESCIHLTQPFRRRLAQHDSRDVERQSRRSDPREFRLDRRVDRRDDQADPLSVEPWYLLATTRSAQGDRQGTALALVEAVKTQPANAEAWRRLGEYELTALGDPKGALAAFQAAYYLDPQSRGAQSDVIEASRAVEAAP